MSKLPEEWTVLPHGPLTALDEGLWTVTGEFRTPLTRLERRMTVARLANGNLVIYSAIALDEAGMRTLEAAGRPAFLVVPGRFHRNDARMWTRRYPHLRVLAPAGVLDAVQEAVPVDATEGDFDDDSVRFETVGGPAAFEVALRIRRGSGTTLVVNDIIGNMPKDAGLVLRLTRFAGDEPHIPLPIKMTLKDEQALRAQLLEWADEPDLTRILVSHGAPIESDVAGRLRQLARTLE
jgi:hypothetical protein